MANPSIPPPPDGSGIAQQQQTQSSAIPPPPDGSGIAQQPPGAPTASMGAANSHSLFKNSTHAIAGNPVAGFFQGFGENIAAGAAGAVDMMNKYSPKNMQISPVVSDTLHDLGNNTKGGAQGATSMTNDLGYGGANLMTFLAGEGEVKALSIPEQLAKMGDSWKVLESNPKLLAALKMGAAAMKAVTELSPEESELVAKYPKLAKLVSLGVESAHAGATQAAQTTVQTGGDVGQGVKEGLEVGVGNAAIGGVAHGLTSKIKAGTEAADALRARAAGETPTALQTGAKAADTLNAAHAGVTGEAQNALDDATSQIHMFGQGAPTTQGISKQATDATVASRKALSANYQAGADQLVDMLKDESGKPVEEPYVGSPIHQTVQNILQGGVVKAGPLDEPIRLTPPGSKNVNELLERLSKVGAPAEEGEAPKPGANSILSEFIKPEEPAGVESADEGEGTEPDTSPTLNVEQAMRYRQAFSEMQRTTTAATSEGKADRVIYGKLVKGLDDTIGKMADGAAPKYDADGVEIPTPAREHFDAMNSAYKQGIQPMKNKDVQAVLKGNLNDVSKRLLSGNTSLDDVDAMRKVVGDQGVKSLGTQTLQRMVADHVDQATGEVDYKKLFKTFQKVNPDVRQAYFGDTGKALEAALRSATSASGTLDDVGQNIKSILGNGDFEQLAADPARLQRFSDAVGPAGMKTMGQSLLEQKLGESALTGAVDPATGLAKKGEVDTDKLMSFWHSFDKYPEMREALFAPDAESKKAYGSFMKQVQDMASTKKLVKYGILPVTLGTAGAVHGPLAALMGATVGLGAEQFGSAKSILEHIANHPATWKALKAATAVVKPLTKPMVSSGIASTLTTLGNDDANNPSTTDQQSIMGAATQNLSGK